MKPLLKVEKLKVTFKTPYATIEAVKGIDFQVEKGEILAIVGESGSGKSASALAIMGLLNREKCLQQGRVYLEGKELLSLPEKDYQKVRGRRIGMVFQDPMTSLNPLMRVGRQITEAIHRHKRVSREKAKRRALELLERVGMAEGEKRLAQYPHELSGGMRQRVMIAMALACEPSLLIADEPTTSLDMTIQAQILELLKSLREESGTSILLITHDLGVVAAVADRMAVMYAGQIAEQGKTGQLFSHPSHPYTKGLLDSVPQRVALGDKLRTIPGSPPDLTLKLPGCPFHPRCAYAMEICQKKSPPSFAIEEGQTSQCWLHHEGAQSQHLLFKGEV